MRHVAPGFTILAALLIAVPARADAPSTTTVAAVSARAETIAWHVVRDGDTLEGLSQRYLGQSERWPENWHLNPKLANPHKLTPGTRLQIKVGAGGGGPDALLSRKSQTVDDKLGPLTWSDAVENDLLLDRDGLRTREKSSAELTFDDGARLLVTEDSLLFLRRRGAKLVPEAPREVEIEQGTADVRAGERPAQNDIEIVFGDAHATSKLRGQANGDSRVRRATSGEGAFMVYRGSGAVEAAGTRFDVAQGTGSVVPASGPPAPPEALLPAPRVTSPASGAVLGCNNPPLRWAAVPGAATYEVDLCRDADCAALVDRASGVTEPTWRSAALAAGDYFLRVAARSASGLDGYPTLVPFRIAPGAAVAGAAAATATIAATGVNAQRGDTLWLDGRSQLALVSSDGSSPAGAALLLDGKPAALEALHGPWPTGPHTAAVTVAGACGEPETLSTVRFAVDSEPPSVRWETANLPPSPDQMAAKETEKRRRFPPPVRWPLPAQLEWSLDGISWVPFSWGVPQPWQRGPLVPPAAWYSTLDDPENPGRLPQPVDESVLYLRAPQANPFRAGSPVKLEGWTALALHVTDGGSGVARLYPRPIELAKGNWVLRIQVADAVGNRQVIDWPIVAKSGK